MGPRPNGRGKWPAAAQPPEPGRRVNGAAAKRPRKDVYGELFDMSKIERQWGRGQTAAESRLRRLAF